MPMKPLSQLSRSELYRRRRALERERSKTFKGSFPYKPSKRRDKIVAEIMKIERILNRKYR